MNVPTGTFGPLMAALFEINTALQLAMVAVFKPRVVVRLSVIVVLPGVVLGVQDAFETAVVAPIPVPVQGSCAHANEPQAKARERTARRYGRRAFMGCPLKKFGVMFFRTNSR